MSRYSIARARVDYANVCAKFGADSALADCHRDIAQSHGHDIWCLSGILSCECAHQS